jgi:hypothetical protein
MLTRETTAKAPKNARLFIIYWTRIRPAISHAGAWNPVTPRTQAGDSTYGRGTPKFMGAWLGTVKRQTPSSLWILRHNLWKSLTGRTLSLVDKSGEIPGGSLDNLHRWTTGNCAEILLLGEAASGGL